jgi:adenosylcobinamide-phosphate synthase
MILEPLVLALSLIVDRGIGDPHSPYHPVALAGRFIGWWGRPVCWTPATQRLAGVVFWFLTIFLFALPFYLFGRFAPWYLYLLIGPFLLKCCFAWRSLEEHTRAVVSSVHRDLVQARDRAGMLVSRDTSALGQDQVLSAAYESMTENLVDSIIAPLLYFGVFGLTGAAVYRAANTMDAMLGYRDERARMGWWSARMDDLFNFIPARVTGILLLAYFVMKGRGGPAYHVLIRDRKKRPGINGGIPMAIMAGGVGIRFEKQGVYTIGDGERSLYEAGSEIVGAVRMITVTFSVLVIGTLILWVYLANMYGI